MFSFSTGKKKPASTPSTTPDLTSGTTGGPVTTTPVHSIANVGITAPTTSGPLALTLADFQQATPGSYRSRSEVAKIDTALSAYAALGTSDSDLAKRAAELKSLITLCAGYTGNRSVGVNQLHATLLREQTFIDPISEAVGKIDSGGTAKAGLKLVIAGTDILLLARRQGHPISDQKAPDTSNMFDRANRALSAAGNRSQVMAELIAEDVQALEAMAGDNAVDPLMRAILAEVLHNKDATHFQETGGVASGAVLANQKDRDKGITKKYRLDMQMNQAEGSAERQSSLVHEMTHIATQEAFSNTAIHLAFKKGANDTAVLKLSQDRTAQVYTLKSALDGCAATFSAGQLRVLDEKVTYPIEGKNTLQSYADTFKKKNELTDLEYQRINGLVTAGANNTLIEFDTVINQMMFLMTAWKIPANNPFYLALKPVAAEAHTHRTS